MRQISRRNGGINMKILIAAALGLSVAACNQTTQGEGPGPVAQSGAPQAEMVAEAPPADAPRVDTLAPLYEPMVDMRKVKRDRYERDLAACREHAAPQEALARQAAERQQLGAALQVAGAVASFIPVSTFRQAHVLATATNAAQAVGGATAEGAAMTAEQELQNYRIIVDNCLAHRRYRLLQG
jgi:hypothetical protein